MFMILLSSCSKTSDFDDTSSINEDNTIVSDNSITSDNNTSSILTNDDLKDLYNNIIINDNNPLEYVYSNELLDIKATFNINDYNPLSKQEIIDKYHYASDYYDEKHIEKMLDNNNPYYDLILDSIDNNASISLSISKPGYYTYKDILSQYSDTSIEKLIKEYEQKGYSNVSISIDTIDFLKQDNKTALLCISYTTDNNTNIYQYTLFIINNQYIGTLNIVSINEDRFNDVINMFEKIENEIGIILLTS